MNKTRALVIGAALVGLLVRGADAATITLTSPSTNLTFSAGDEFSTTFVGCPWDMDQIRDIPFDFNYLEPSVANNEWTGTFLNARAAFYPLWRGFTGGYPYFYDGGMPMAALNPIDTDRYSRLSLRISLSQKDRSSFWIIWTTNLNETENNATSMGFVDGDYAMSASQTYPDGYRIYDLGFTTEEFFTDRVRSPSGGFELHGAWSVPVYGFLLHPTLDGAPGTTLKVNWMRLYNPNASPKLQLGWSTTDVAPDDDYRYSVQLWVDTDDSGYDGDMMASCLKNDGAYELNTAALPPGNYYFYLKLMRRDTVEWSEMARSTYSALVNITHPPSFEFTAPTYTSGEDYATAVLGNPWDMSDASDIYNPLHISDISFANGVLVASADGPVPPAAESDSQFYLNTSANGQWRPIDTTKYHYLTFRMMVSQAGYTNVNDWMARGWYPRIIWCNEDISVDGSETQGVALFENWHSYTVNLADRSLLSTGNPYPAQKGWTEMGTIKRMRFDPLEVYFATQFAIDSVKLCADNMPANNRYTISWSAADPDSQLLTVSLYYGSLSGTNFSGRLIATVTNAPGIGSCTWDTSGVNPGSYFIQAVVSDGLNVLVRNSRVPVVVSGAGGDHFTLSNAAALAADFDGDAKADPALYQASTAHWQTKFSSASYSLIDLPALAGGEGYSALAADFDGDSLADPAVYSAADASWEVRLSGTGYAPLNLPGFMGGVGYSALAADFDGDSLADPAVYSAADASWEVRLSGGGYAPLSLPGFMGGVGYSALAADFDGDRLADPTVYSAADASWEVHLSGGGYAPLNLPGFMGGVGFAALAADYDGDLLADPMVFDTDSGTWLMRLSSGAYAESELPL